LDGLPIGMVELLVEVILVAPRTTDEALLSHAFSGTHPTASDGETRYTFHGPPGEDFAPSWGGLRVRLLVGVHGEREAHPWTLPSGHLPPPRTSPVRDADLAFPLAWRVGAAQPKRGSCGRWPAPESAAAHAQAALCSGAAQRRQQGLCCGLCWSWSSSSCAVGATAARAIFLSSHSIGGTSCCHTQGRA
jgi:hypothetical protein